MRLHWSTIEEQGIGSRQRKGEKKGDEEERRDGGES